MGKTLIFINIIRPFKNTTDTQHIYAKLHYYCPISKHCLYSGYFKERWVQFIAFLHRNQGLGVKNWHACAYFLNGQLGLKTLFTQILSYKTKRNIVLHLLLFKKKLISMDIYSNNKIM